MILIYIAAGLYILKAIFGSREHSNYSYHSGYYSDSRYRDTSKDIITKYDFVYDREGNIVKFSYDYPAHVPSKLNKK